MRGVDNGWDYAYVEARDKREISAALSAQIFCEPQTAIKYKIC